MNIFITLLGRQEEMENFKALTLPLKLKVDLKVVSKLKMESLWEQMWTSNTGF